MTHQLPDELADGELEEILVRFAGQYNVYAHAAHTDNNQPYPCLEEAKALIATHTAKAVEAARVDEHNLVFTKSGEMDAADFAFWSSDRLETLGVKHETD